MITPDLKFETEILAGGARWIAGVDEAGRGAWAGPVFAGAVILPLHAARLEKSLQGVRDSKLMSARQRNRWFELIKQSALSWAVGAATHSEVDRLGIIPATHLAMERALHRLQLYPDHLLIDHLKLPGFPQPQTTITHGDALSLSIAAASILAKVSRDQAMVDYEQHYPGYGFGRHKGYGTREHRFCLGRLGPSPIHRRTYGPVQGCKTVPASRLLSQPGGMSGPAP
jgi:ribonuclease HII